jgi:hypothetical protein
LPFLRPDSARVKRFTMRVMIRPIMDHRGVRLNGVQQRSIVTARCPSSEKYLFLNEVNSHEDLRKKAMP